jgi:hypothetical protein
MTDMHRVLLDRDFGVETDCAHFAAFLARLYPTLPPDAHARIRVRVRRHGDLPRSPAGGRPEEILVQRDPVKPEFQRHGLRHRTADGTVVTVVPESGTTVEYRGPDLPLCVASACRGDADDIITRYKTDDAFRTVRHALYALLVRRGDVWCHGAAVDTGSGALLVVGASRSGKTSTLVHLLRRGGYAFMSNGRSFVRTGGPAGLRVAAFPEIVQLRQGFLAGHPQLRARLGIATADLHPDAWAAPEATKVSVFGTDFARALDAGSSHGARVRGLVLPVLDRGPLAAPPTLAADDVEKVLADNLFVEEYLDEYTWFEGDRGRDGAPGPERPGQRDRVCAALTRLPRLVSYLDARGRITLTEEGQ